MPLTPRKIFDQVFTHKELNELFNEKIKKTKAVGRDGVRIEAFQAKLNSEIDLIIKKVFAKTYKFTRYKEKLVSKGAYKLPRMVSIPTIRDRLTLRALFEFLFKVFEDAAIKKPHQYIKEIRDYLPDAPPESVFVRIDIKNYYGTIEKNILLKNIRRRTKIQEAIHLIYESIHTPTSKKSGAENGIPQGLSISNILASIYLLDVDKKMSKNWKYFRYVDDMLVICERTLAEQAYEELSGILKKKKLYCHPLDIASGKSYVADLNEGVDYLGFNIKPEKISIRESSYKKMLSTVISVITENKYIKNNQRLIWRLNLKISGCIYNNKNYGWMFFFIQTDDINQLSRLDYFISSQLRKLRLGSIRNQVKRFVKAYHEIRYNISLTTYVPNFDDFTIDDMRILLIQITSKGKATINSMTDDEVTRLFDSIVGREVSTLEKDLIEFFS